MPCTFSGQCQPECFHISAAVCNLRFLSEICPPASLPRTLQSVSTWPDQYVCLCVSIQQSPQSQSKASNMFSSSVYDRWDTTAYLLFIHTHTHRTLGLLQTADAFFILHSLLFLLHLLIIAGIGRLVDADVFISVTERSSAVTELACSENWPFYHCIYVFIFSPYCGLIYPFEKSQSFTACSHTHTHTLSNRHTHICRKVNQVAGSRAGLWGFRKGMFGGGLVMYGLFLPPFFGTGHILQPTRLHLSAPVRETINHGIKCFLHHHTRGSSHDCVIFTAGSSFIIYYLSFLHFFLESIVFCLVLTVRINSSSCDWNVAGTLICIQNLGSGFVCCYLCFSVWEFLLAPVNIRGWVAVNQIRPWWSLLQHSAELKTDGAHSTHEICDFYSCGVQRFSGASGDDAGWITKVPNPLGLCEPHTLLRPGQLSEARCILVWNLQ